MSSRYWAVLAAALAVGAGLTSTAASRGDDGCDLPPAVAHRGGGHESTTENTLAAYAHAARYGSLTWETDVQWDASGMPVLMHDPTIDRTTTGSGRVADTAWSRSTATTKDGQRLRDQTLARLLALAEQHGATLAIEPKSRPTRAQAKAVLAMIDATIGRDRIILDSYETSHLAPFKALAARHRTPGLTYALVTREPVDPADAAEVGPILNIKAAVLTRQLVDAYHAAGLKVYAWTVDEPEQWAAQRGWGIDAYVTNYPIRYRAWRDWACSDVYAGQRAQL